MALIMNELSEFVDVEEPPRRIKLKPTGDVAKELRREMKEQGAEIVKCEVCGSLYERKKKYQRYCCTECRNRAKVLRIAQPANEHPEADCPNCGKRFKKKVPHQVYCCIQCKKKAHRRKYMAKRREQKTKVAGI